jgi:hypothetical protein
MRLPLSDRDYVIQGYLDSLTTYASTVCDLLDDDRVASDIGDGFDDGLDHTANPVSPEVKPSVQLDVTTATQKKGYCTRGQHNVGQRTENTWGTG